MCVPVYGYKVESSNFGALLVNLLVFKKVDNMRKKNLLGTKVDSSAYFNQRIRYMADALLFVGKQTNLNWFRLNK